MSKRFDVEMLRTIIAAKKGRLVSPEYDKNGRVLVQCAEGHEWYARVDHLREGHWCRTCSAWISERICRRYFERLFGEKFPTKRPEWLRNAEGNRLELDGYAEVLGLAFEHQGRQHYEDIKAFGKKNIFAKRQRDDAIKRKLCQQHKVILIEIPHHLPREELQGYIVKEARYRGVVVPHADNIIRLEELNIYSPEKIGAMQLLAAPHKGRCLSTLYVDNRTSLEWECNQGHMFKARPGNVLSGKWCPHCNATRRDARIKAIGKGKQTVSLIQCRNAAKKKGGVLLSTALPSHSVEKLRWRCAKGHEFTMRYSHVLNGHWCATCGYKQAGITQRCSLEIIQQFAKKKGGVCLSTGYHSNRKNLEWKCEHGHEWRASWSNIQRGTWCPDCFNANRRENMERRKLGIEKMQEIARKKGGTCLSSKYVNANTKLRWRCQKGHEWLAAPAAVYYRQSWCEKCYRERRKKHSD